MYDPIMCMNIPDSVKTKDAMFNVVYKTDSGTMQALLKADNEKDAENKVRVREGNKFKSLIGVKKMGDSVIDKAIRNCDDLNSDKEKALEEYKKAKKAYEEKSSNAKTLQEFKELSNTKEFKEFMDKKRICMKLGCRI